LRGVNACSGSETLCGWKTLNARSAAADVDVYFRKVLRFIGRNREKNDR
jgi:hypothetical protein